MMTVETQTVRSPPFEKVAKHTPPWQCEETTINAKRKLLSTYRSLAFLPTIVEATMGTLTSRRLISRKKLKRQCMRSAFVMVCLSMLITEGIGNESSRGVPPLLSTLFMSPIMITTRKQPLVRPRSRHYTDTYSYRQTESGLFRRRRGRRLDDPSNSEDSSASSSSSSSQQESSTERRGSSTDGENLPKRPLPGPPPPKELPLRFLRAGKNDPEEGWRRYQATLQWRRDEGMDTILREPNPQFDIIQQHYLHYFHGTGYHGEPVFYEMPAKTNLKALREGGVGLQLLLRYYSFITEFQWQYLNRDDHATSIYVVDLEGIRLTDFVGETREFVVTAARLSAQHYPERGGTVLLINVPRWFQAIWKVIRPIVSESTLEKIFILRGEDEIRQKLQEHIPLERIPREYGGTSPILLGESPEENLLAGLVKHNNRLAVQKQAVCSGCTNDLNSTDWPCRFCRWTPARSY